MIRSALRLCAAFVVMAGLLPIAHAVACAYDNVLVLPASFDPSSAMSDPPTTTERPATHILADIAAALAIAPQFLKTQLCNLDGIYITREADSWGYRNIASGRRYIALTDSLWAGYSANIYSEHEVRSFFRLTKHWEGPGYPVYNNPADTGAETVLAALSHEYGHVLFVETFVSPRGSTPNYTSPSFCGGQFFSESWQTLPTSPVPWRAYGATVGTHKPDDMQTTDLLDILPPTAGNDYRAAHMLDRILGLNGTGAPIGRWAGLFATFSPEEDFVETFKLFVLKNSTPPLSSMPFGYYMDGNLVQQDIPGTCSQRTVLVKKLGCFAQKFCTTQPTPNACSRCP